MSPVYAPDLCGERSCAPYPMRRRSPSISVCTLRRSVNGGSTTTSTEVSCCSLRLNAIFCVSAIASRWFRFIFQLPAMSGRRPSGSSGFFFATVSGLRFEGGNTRKGLALQVLQRRTAAGRDVAERRLVQAERPDGRRRVAAADDRQTVHSRHRLRDGTRALRERRELEHAHRAVPEHCLGR